MSKTQPIELRIDDDGRLVIRWSDDQQRWYSVRRLREQCPCATCRTKRAAWEPGSELPPVLSPGEAESVRVKSMTPVGTYGYSIAFSDEHDTGIYTFELLRELGEIGS